MSTLSQEASEAPKISKNFRNSADVENFYRFVHENDLRNEAKIVLEMINKVVNPKKAKTKRKRRARKVQ